MKLVRHGPNRRILASVVVGILGVIVAATVLNRPAPHTKATLPTNPTPTAGATGAPASTCNSAPAVPQDDSLTVTLKAPEKAAAGSTIDVSVDITSSRNRTLTTGSPFFVAIEQNGHVVGGLGPVFGVGRSVELRAGEAFDSATGWGRQPLSLRSCGGSSGPGPGLPPGNYILIGYVESLPATAPVPIVLTG